MVLLVDHSTLLPSSVYNAVLDPGVRSGSARAGLFSQLGTGTISNPGFSAGNYHPRETIPQTFATPDGRTTYLTPRGYVNPYQNSYVSIKEADNYFEARTHKDAWDNLTTPVTTALGVEAIQKLVTDKNNEIQINSNVDFDNIYPAFAALQVNTPEADPNPVDTLDDKDQPDSPSPATLFKEAAKAAQAKAAALIYAVKVLNNHYRWEGRRYYQYQPLAWPRYGSFDGDSYYIDQYVVPPQVKEAQCELALQLILKNRANLEEPDYVGLSEIRLDTLWLKFDKMDRPGLSMRYISAMLSEFTLPGTRVIRT